MNILFAGLVISGDPGWYGLKGVAQRLECRMGREPVLAQGLHQGFAQGKPPPQRLVGHDPEPLKVEMSDTPGWSHYSVPPGAASQTLDFEVQSDKDALIFYPRASGADSSVEAALVRGGKARVSARLQGEKGQWSPISARWIVSLACADKDEPVRVRVTLKGPWAQLWTRDGAAFFEP